VDGRVSCILGVNVGDNLFEHSGIFHLLIGNVSLLLRMPSMRNVVVATPYTMAVQQPMKISYTGWQVQFREHSTSAQLQAIAAFLRTLTGKYRGKTLTASSP
jgi:cytochrome c peroxidase